MSDTASSPRSPRLVACDSETPTLRLRTIEGDIRAAQVILIIAIQHGGDRERAGPRLRGGPHQRAQEILGRACPRERATIGVPGIGERALPGPRELPMRLRNVQYERAPAGEVILERPRPGACEGLRVIVTGTAEDTPCEGQRPPLPSSPPHGMPFPRET